MDTNANVISIAAPVTAAAPAAPVGDFDQRRVNKQAEQAEQATHYRLVIEEGPSQGTFVYKTLDAMTGEIVRQFPREQVLQMAESGDYNAGGLIDTSA